MSTMPAPTPLPSRSSHAGLHPRPARVPRTRGTCARSAPSPGENGEAVALQPSQPAVDRVWMLAPGVGEGGLALFLPIFVIHRLRIAAHERVLSQPFGALGIEFGAEEG